MERKYRYRGFMIVPAGYGWYVMNDEGGYLYPDGTIHPEMETDNLDAHCVDEVEAEQRVNKTRGKPLKATFTLCVDQVTFKPTAKHKGLDEIELMRALEAAAIEKMKIRAKCISHSPREVWETLNLWQ